MQALLAHHSNERRDRDDAVARDVYARIGAPPAPTDLPLAFIRWCDLKGVSAWPAKSETVAGFVLSSALTLDALCNAAALISRAHQQRFADPTASWVVLKAFETVSGETFPRPRSWPKDDELAWAGLGWQVQRCLSETERHRDKTASRARNEFGLVCKECKTKIAQQREKLKARDIEEKHVHENDKTAA
jgi:hypothetical protein